MFTFYDLLHVRFALLRFAGLKQLPVSEQAKDRLK
jgi:hypothetical protein